MSDAPNTWPTCDDCARPVRPEDAAPTCASHDLHIGCSVAFSCRGCLEALREIEADETVHPFSFWAEEPCS
jgi:hypothetical protein